ncbi:MAG: transketolase C-terminal domain-containing protein [Candidatus Omnitrophota bacterium]
METLCEAAEIDDRICLIVGDLGFSVVESFVERFPDRFLNAGVAEQSMTGIATGWALAEKKIVFTYSIANFPTMRCVEQVRNDVCAHKADVKIISLGSGITYGPSGYSHFAVEDLAVMNAMPHMIIFTPADPQEAKHCLDLAVRTPGPAYIRLAKSGEPNLRQSFVPFEIGDFVEYKSGNDLCVLGIGSILSECLSAAKMLEPSLSASVLGLPVLKPLNEKKLVEYLRPFPLLITVEEHSEHGGMAGIISELVVRNGLSPRLIKISLPEGFDRVGPQEDLRKSSGLDAKSIAEKILGSI